MHKNLSEIKRGEPIEYGTGLIIEITYTNGKKCYEVYVNKKDMRNKTYCDTLEGATRHIESNKRYY